VVIEPTIYDILKAYSLSTRFVNLGTANRGNKIKIDQANICIEK
jgi:hypothetical protein